MTRRKKVTVQPKEPPMLLWLPIIASLWMVGVLIWFFSDYKIQEWLAMIFADLFGR